MSEERAYNPSDGMMSLKGKAYLPVAERIVWFRQDYPEGTIETKLLELDREKGFAMYHARVNTGNGGVAEASGSETAKDFGDYIEKSETKAVGRALGYLGYGTASAGFEEGQRIVDAPQPPRAAPAFTRPRQDAPAVSNQAPPAPRPYTEAEFGGVLDAAWGLAEDGKPLAEIKDYLNKLRHQMSKAQHEDARAALVRIEAQYYAPAAVAG